MTTTKPRYARIEEKAPALTWACARSWKYIMDKSISIKTNHKPPVPVLSTPTLDQLPSRIQRFKMRLMTFHFKEITDVRRKKMYIVVALWTVQTQSQAMKLTILDDENHSHIGSVISSLRAWDVGLQQIIEAQEEHPVCMQIKVNSCEGRPHKCSLSDAMKLYWWSRSELSLVQTILLKAYRIIMAFPCILRSRVRSMKDTKESLNATSGQKLCLVARSQPRNTWRGATIQNSSISTSKLLQASLIHIVSIDSH